MVAVSTVPARYDITCYGGDTLRLEVILAAGYADGFDWNAQVRQSRAADVMAAVFTITEPTAPGEPAYLMLPGAVTLGLTEDGDRRFEGFWDVQVSDAGSDPVTTLVQGAFRVEADVTRLTP